MKSLTRISKLNPFELKKNHDLMMYFKKKVNYKNINNSNYESNSFMNNPEEIQKKLLEMQNEGYNRDFSKMIYSEKLLEALHRIKWPSYKSIFNKGFDETRREGLNIKTPSLIPTKSSKSHRISNIF